ncbi:MAG: Asp-tRNA(Asn)/Glu-tRNA(Gln) amidotransferase subunit GatB, partial [bacterium]|nr:Asp-tRNA(Asn)/Glu-tRNA(Gln) amidotransferase subunit GatB [bacterium]
MQLTPTIGLEIHVEMETKTKMFCGCLNDSDERHPNINVCPICMGHPGTLPVINKEAVKNVLKTGMALGGKLADFSRFDRKNYFYPDLPKGYQISQYKHPLVEGGELNDTKIRRIHLEEDTGRLLHHGDESLVDFNRAGVPLMELVTEPDITSGRDAKAFSEELQLVLRYLGVSSADMEKGEMRCEVNISLNMGTKVEIKNLNSFRAVEKAIEYEIERQKEVLEQGEKVEQETRGWDENKQKTFSQRKKEEAHDYRYFPEPDLPSLDLTNAEFQQELGFPLVLPELPWQKRKRFEKEYGLKDDSINVLIRDKQLSDFFEETISELKAEAGVSSSPELVFNYLSSDLVGLMNDKYLVWDDLKVSPHAFGELMALVFENKISSRSAKDILKIMAETGKDAKVIVQEEKLEQTSDKGFIEEAVKKIIETNPKAVSDYKNGKEESLQFLIGQVIRETRGKANPD